MTTYEKKLKRGKDGLIVRYVGKNHKGVKEKFRLGYDLAEAERRVRLIQALWDAMERPWTVAADSRVADGWTYHREPLFWKPEYLKAAKEIAKGGAPVLPKDLGEEPAKFIKRLAEASAKTGTKFEPANPADLTTAISSVQEKLRESRNTLSLAINTPEATGQTLEQAFDGYEAYVRKKSTDAAGSVSPWGKTKLDQVASIRAYLKDERFGGLDFLALDLAELNYTRCDDIFGVFRCRPPTLRTNLQRRMTPASAKHIIKELGCFFDWLDGADTFDWMEPRRFRKISKTPDKPSAEEQYQRRERKKRSIIPTEHLKILLEYSMPIERVLLLLGLNCAFGAAEVGQLAPAFRQASNKPPDIPLRTLWNELFVGHKQDKPRQARSRFKVLWPPE